ncbi:hypothetical protein IKD67_03610 [Candidatus Saccharibacteria bacterium]|nr:hypothetical protein [Candidatus Saccharibacteria bacterium]
MMNNNYYVGTNGVLVGFNVWPMLLVLGIIVMVVVGKFQYNMVDGRVHRRYNEKFLQIVAATLSVIVEFSMIAEMGQGAALKIESFLGAMMGFTIVGVLMIVIYWGIGETIGRNVKNKLKAYS